MNRVNLTIGTTFLSCLLGAPALAEPPPANPPPSKEAKDLECLVGNWKGGGTLKAGADSADIKASLTCKRTAGSWGLECRLHMTGVPGMGSYEESDLFGYDPGSGKYHWFSVTNGAETHDHQAAPPTGADVDWTYTGQQDGKPLKELVKFTFGPGPVSKTLAVRCEQLVDGKSTSLMQVSLKK